MEEHYNEFCRKVRETFHFEMDVFQTWNGMTEMEQQQFAIFHECILVAQDVDMYLKRMREFDPTYVMWEGLTEEEAKEIEAAYKQIAIEMDAARFPTRMKALQDESEGLPL